MILLDHRISLNFNMPMFYYILCLYNYLCMFIQKGFPFHVHPLSQAFPLLSTFFLDIPSMFFVLMLIVHLPNWNVSFTRKSLIFFNAIFPVTGILTAIQ